MQAEKTLPNARVKRRVLLEPLVWLSLLEPKLQDVPNPPIFRIIGDSGTLQDLRINSMCATRTRWRLFVRHGYRLYGEDHAGARP